MTAPLNLLIIEDSPADFLLALRHLGQDGLAVEGTRVDRLGDLRAALASRRWDAVLSDYSVPGLAFRETLEILEQGAPDLPLILFSGSIGEEEAVALLKTGVWDYVLKDRPGRLASALQGSLREAEARRNRREVLAALAASEARFQATFEQAGVGIAQVGLDGRILRANQRLCDILGYTRKELLALASQDMSAPEWSRATWARIQGLVRGEGSTFTEEKPNLRKDGSVVWVSLSVTLVCDPHGEPDYIVTVVEDIHRRREAERALHDSEALLRSIMDSLGPALVVLDADGTVVHVNASGAATGKERVGVGGNYFAALGEALPAATAGQARDGLRAVLQGRRPRFDMEFLRELSGRQSWFHLGATPLSGPRPGLVLVHTDISSRMESDLALRASEERFSAVFMASPIAILLVRAGDGVILDANPAFQALSGLEPGFFLGRREADLPFWTDPAQRRQARDRQRAQGHLHAFEMTFRHASGSTGWASLSSEEVRISGQPVRVDLFLDVTGIRAAQDKEREMERELNHLQRLESIGRLAGGVSHDMNNVLGAIMALAGSLKLQHGDLPEVARSAEAILHAGTRGRHLVKGLTDFARMDLANAIPVDLNELLRSEAELLERTTFQRISVRTELQVPLPPVLGEANALSNVLMNLCVNACDAMPDGGTLVLATRLRDDRRVEVSVADTGEGMAPEVAARALEPFFTTKPAGKGTGLGLSIVFGTVKAHGGTVEIHSSPGLGTRVLLAFPPAPATAAGAPEAAAVDPGQVGPLRILLVDDDELIRQSLPLLLQLMGHQTEVAAGGHEALVRLRAGLEPDLVILDLNMPGLGGMETLAELRHLRPELRVLISTGQRDARVEEAVLRFSGVGILDKPFLMEDLQRALGCHT